MKYKNTIILIVIIVIIGILIYRWYFNSFEGFLTNDDNLLKLTDISTYDYLWSNNLLLNQKGIKPESLIVLQKPKISTSNGKIIGSMVANSLDDINNKTVIVSKDVKSPIKLEEIFKLSPDSKMTSEPVFNKLLTYEELIDNTKRNANIVDMLNSSLSELQNIFGQIGTKIADKYDIKLYKMSLGEEGETKKLNVNTDGSISLSFNNPSGFNAISFPVGSTVKITKNNGSTETFYIPTEYMIDKNNNFIPEEEINYNTLFNGLSNIDGDKYNPFGKYGLGCKNNNNNNQNLYTNAGRKYNYNYALGSSKNESQALNSKEKLGTYIESDSVVKTGPVANNSKNSYIKINGNLYFVNHIVEIDNNDTNHNINDKRNISRYIYKYGTKIRSKRASKCSNKNNFSINKIGDYSDDIYCNPGEKLLNYRNCGPKRKRAYCINNDNFITANNNSMYSNYIYINREWIPFSEYEKYISIKYSSGFFPCKIKFAKRIDVSTELEYSFDIPKNNTYQPYTTIRIERTSSVSESINAINNFLNMNNSTLFNVYKRNILACLWHDGKVTIENFYKDDKDPNILFKFDKVLDTVNNEGPAFSPYVTIEFDNKNDAKEYVANILNKIQRNLENNKKKFKTPTITKNTIDLTDIMDIRSNKERNINKIQQDINEVLDNFKLEYNSLSGSKTEDIDNLKKIIQESMSVFSNNLNTYNVNLMMSLPNFSLKNDGNIESNYIDLSNGSIVQYYNKITNVNITMTEDPISLLLQKNLTNLTNQIETFITIFTKNGNKYDSLMNQISKGELKHYPLTIHRPIPPTGYKALGDIVEITGYTDEKSSALYNKNPRLNITEYGCVPEQCVVEVRPWLASDKIYEYSNDGKYLGLFRNPYLNTFRSTKSRNALPEGGVEKIVACVAKSRIIDDLKKAESCANEYKRGYEQIIKDSSLDRDNILYDKQESRMQSAIASRQDTINSLKNELKQMQKQDRKAIIINHSINRKKFQDLLDRQIYNMDKLITNLYSIISINVNMGELIAKLREKGIGIDKIEEIISTIKTGKRIYSLKTTTSDSGSSISDASTEEGTTASGAEADSHIAEPVKLQRIIYKTKDGREQEMILRSLVESSCGCYFTDEEIIRTR
jgi:hypothetical protein